MKRTFINCTGQGDKSIPVQEEHVREQLKKYWEDSPAFRETLFRSQEWFPHIRIIELILFEDDKRKFVPTEVAQPLAYTLALAMAGAIQEQKKERAFKSKQSIYGGQSIGTAAALALAGTYTEEFGARMVAERSALMHEACAQIKGKMEVLLIYPEHLADIEELCLQQEVQIGNYNSPSQVVLTGPVKSVGRIAKRAISKKFARRRIPILTEGAYHHSELMKPVVDPFRTWLTIHLPELTISRTIIGNQGQVLDSRESIIWELADGIAAPSRFHQAMETAYTKLGARRTLECGPAQVIKGMVEDFQKTLHQSSSKRWRNIALGITVATATTVLAAQILRDKE
jgi:malonyl CoA-acyl carrier protein transacylase